MTKVLFAASLLDTKASFQYRLFETILSLCVSLLPPRDWEKAHEDLGDACRLPPCFSRTVLTAGTEMGRSSGGPSWGWRGSITGALGEAPRHPPTSDQECEFSNSVHGKPGAPSLVTPFPLSSGIFTLSLCPASSKACPQKSREQISSHQGLIGYFLQTSFIVPGDQTPKIILLSYNYITIHNYLDHQQAAGGNHLLSEYREVPFWNP